MTKFGIVMLTLSVALTAVGFLSHGPILNGMCKAAGGVCMIIFLIQHIFTGPALTTESKD